MSDPTASADVPINIEHLIQTIKAEAIRQQSGETVGAIATVAPAAMAQQPVAPVPNPADAVLQRIDLALRDAQQQAQGSLRWPDRFSRFPFSLSKKLQSGILRAHRFLFKKQTVVNLDLVHALNEVTVLLRGQTQSAVVQQQAIATAANQVAMLQQQLGQQAQQLELQAQQFGQQKQQLEQQTQQFQQQCQGFDLRHQDITAWLSNVGNQQTVIEEQIQLLSDGQLQRQEQLNQIEQRQVERGEWLNNLNQGQTQLQEQLNQVQEQLNQTEQRQVERGDWLKGLNQAQTQFQDQLNQIEQRQVERGDWLNGLNQAQTQFQEQLSQLVAQQAERVNWLGNLNQSQTQVQEWLNQLDSRQTQTEQSLQGLNRLAEIQTKLEQQQLALDERWLRETSHLKEALSQQRKFSNLLLENSARRFNEQEQPLQPNRSQALGLQSEGLASHNLDAFYAAFEDEFRGSREDIAQRLQVYLPRLEAVRDDLEKFEVLDLGTGRGEWLELLCSSGYQASGVDSNQIMAERCRARGLQVVEGDAISYLRELPEQSVGAITGFHIIEHLPFLALMELFQEAIRVLRPGGLVIFETPNPENILVGASSFYSDPTHQNPLVSNTVRFMAEYAGFQDAEILNLHPCSEDASLGGSPLAQRFSDYFYGPQDYALIARRGAVMGALNRD